MRTTDNLIDPNRRDITTVWTTDLRVNEGTYNAGTVRVALETTHNKQAKRLESRLHREVLTDDGIITFSFMLYGPATADAGIVLETELVARFNAKKAATLHDFVLTNLEHFLVGAEHRHPEVARELSDLLANAKAVAA